MKSPLEQALTGRIKKEKMSAFLSEHPEMFDEAVTLSLSNKQPIAWRAAWAIGGSLPENREKLSPFIDDILDKLPELEDGHQREFIKILIQCELTEDQMGLLFDICVSIWEQVRKKPSVRYFAFQVMVDMTNQYPELANEVLSLTQPQHISTLSPGIKKGILKLVDKISS